MSNILKIIASDIKRLSVNVVAYVVIIGLSVLPCLYAWFNILSNWDPYGAESTCNLQVAVASSDEGMTIAGVELNVGDIIIENLKQNTTIGWVFTDTAEEAINGVYSGDYYAALVIDEQFSNDMVSFLGGNVTNPKITYYENEKKNAIAPKITSKVKTTVQREVDSAFVSTIAEVILKASDNIVSIDSNGSLSGTAITKMESLDKDLTAVILILDSYIALMDSNENLMTASEAVSDNIDSLIESANTMADSAEVAAESMETVVDSSAKLVSSSLTLILNELDKTDDLVDDLADTLGDGAGDVELVSQALEDTTKEQYASWVLQETTLKLSSDYDTKYKTNCDSIDADYKDLLGESYINAFNDSSNSSTYKNKTTAIGTDSALYKLESSAAEASADTSEVSSAVKADINESYTAINAIINEYNSVTSPQIQTTLNTVDSSLKEIEKLLKFKTSNIDAVVATLGSYPEMLGTSKDSLQQARDEAAEMEEQLSALIDDMNDLETNEQYAKVIDLLENDPEYLADFISSPVNVSEEYAYPIENNGSMTAPFYIVLSIWVGALIMSTILKTTVKDKRGLKNVKNWECFVGRYFVTFLIGQIQTIITVFGALLYVDIQCLHPFLFWLACSWTATVYSLLLYSFTYSFGNIGEALSVILMVIQVAGAGGTFPIEVLPKVFQVLYKFMPFNYSMNALRECIGGFYGHRYWIYMVTLLVYVGLAIVNGVVLYYPCLRLNKQIEASKEKSGILI